MSTCDNKTRLIIKGRLPSLNDYIYECRRNKYSGAAMKKEAQAYILYNIIIQLKSRVLFNTPIRLSFIWYEQNNKRDLDNIAFAKKFILDALVQSKKLPDDGWKYVRGFTDEFYVDKKNPRIEVVIEELGEAK